MYNKSEWEWVNPEKEQSNSYLNPSEWEVVQPISEEEQQRGFGGKLLRDIAIGMVHAGRNLHNAPHDIAQGIEESTQPFGELFKSLPGREYYAKPHAPLSQYLPNDTMDYSFIFGQNAPAEFPHNYIQKGIEYLPDVIFARNALRDLIPHLTKRGATKKLRKARELGIERKMNPLNVKPELIEDMRQFLPNTQAYRNLIDEAHAGDYQKLFNLQSDVGNESAARARDIFSSAQRSHGKAGFKSQNALLEDMSRALQEEGHLDISDLMKTGRQDFRRYKEFKPYRNILGGAALAALIPQNVWTHIASKILQQKTQ